MATLAEQCARGDHTWDWKTCDTKGDHYVCLNSPCPAKAFLAYEDCANEPTAVA